MKKLDEFTKHRLTMQIAAILATAKPAPPTDVAEILEADMEKTECLPDGSRIVTAEQFRLLEWAAKQLKIRLLQVECDSILQELDKL